MEPFFLLHAVSLQGMGSRGAPEWLAMNGRDPYTQFVPQYRRSHVQALSRIFRFPDNSTWVVDSMSAMGIRFHN
jgi:hypothetical protein